MRPRTPHEIYIGACSFPSDLWSIASSSQPASSASMASAAAGHSEDRYRRMTSFLGSISAVEAASRAELVLFQTFEEKR